MKTLSFFSKYNRYIIYTTLSALFSKCLYGLNYNEAFKIVRISGEDFSNNFLIHKFFSYLGIILFATIFYKIEVYSSRRKSRNKPILKDKDKEKDKGKEEKQEKQEKQEKKEKEEKQEKQEKEEKQEKIKKKEKKERDKINEIELIYIDTEEEHKKFKSFKLLCLYLLIILTWILEDQLLESFYLMFQNLDFWMIELFIICYLNSIVFRVQIFRHQIVAIFFSVFSSLLKIATIVLSFYDDPKERYGGNLPIYYIKNNVALKIFFGILLYLILIFLRSTVNLSLKWYMDIQYISPNQILIVFGILGTILYFIFTIVVSKFNCEHYSDYDYHIYNYICKVKNNNNYYIDSFYNYFNNYKSGFFEIIREIIVIILGIFAFFFNKLFSILVIKYLSPVHVIFSVPILFMLEKIVMISNTLIVRNISEKKEEKHFAFLATDNTFKFAKFCLDISGDVFSLTGFLIYLEIIRLKCWQMNYNIKTNIIKRGAVEAMINEELSESNTLSSNTSEDGNALFRDSKSLENSL